MVVDLQNFTRLSLQEDCKPRDTSVKIFYGSNVILFC